ncbi:MAG: HPr family phosphocarrier protein [Blautia sp.]|nr:HPr family phosphocarrier protein [Blautia sp.]MDY4000522.1 HPr family phosphocarrier protein [Blautia sp.]
MQQVYVKFNNVEQVTNFINIIDKIDIDFDLGMGNRTVDAKSVIGVFGLDLTKPQLLRYDSDDHRIMEKITPFLAAAE